MAKKKKKKQVVSDIKNDELKKEDNQNTEKDFFSKAGTKLSLFFKKTFQIIKYHFKLILTVFVILLTLVNVTSHLIGGKVMKDYKDYSSHQIAYNQILNKKGTYYVYFYSNDCSHCQDLKKYIFQYIDSDKNDKENGIPLYIFCVDNYLEELTSESEAENILGVTDVKELKLTGTPTMVLIANKEIKNAWSSTNNIKNQLKN